jgi:hypothetical protein
VRKTFTILLVLSSILWQTVATAGQGMLLEHAEGLAHAVLHWEKQGHHHHDDGSVDQDNSPESVQHILADAQLNTTGVLPALRGTALPGFGSCTRAPGPDSALPPPFLEATEQPPRLTV